MQPTNIGARHTLAPLVQVDASKLSLDDFVPGSMRPKMAAAIEFARSTGRPCAIGRLEDAAAIVAGARGTRIHAHDVTYNPSSTGIGN
jgi:carbamate kinase